ncbi:MAG: hypothetical protein C5B46_05605 [Proteobacteria bacterium]|nr:MAG: hypothetical protein C5B46_05605 [Pseudomonadota bacterium]
MNGDRPLQFHWRVTETPVAEQLQLAFAADCEGKTWLRHQRVAYPYHVGRCLELSGDPHGMATVYVQCCSGGLFEHDDVRGSIDCGSGAKAHVTTSAATVVHDMPSGGARQAVEIWLGTDALLEYLPDATILFPGARLENRMNVHLGDRAVALIWDTVLMHAPDRLKPRSNAAEPKGPARCLKTELKVSSASGMLACDRWILAGKLGSRLTPGILEAYACQGSFLVLAQARPEISSLIERIRTECDGLNTCYFGVTALPNDCGLIVRVLAEEATEIKKVLNKAWRCARLALVSAEAVERRK